MLNRCYPHIAQNHPLTPTLPTRSMHTLLTPHPPTPSMHILLKRYRKKPATIDGYIKIADTYICDTAESAAHALPPGTYSIVISQKGETNAGKLIIVSTSPSSHSSPILSHPLASSPILSRPLASSPILTSGNGVYTYRDSRILVGKYIAPGCLSHSGSIYKTLSDRIRRSIKRGHEVTLQIKEEYR